MSLWCWRNTSHHVTVVSLECRTSIKVYTAGDPCQTHFATPIKCISCQTSIASDLHIIHMSEYIYICINVMCLMPYASIYLPFFDARCWVCTECMSVFTSASHQGSGSMSESVIRAVCQIDVKSQVCVRLKIWRQAFGSVMWHARQLDFWFMSVANACQTDVCPSALCHRSCRIWVESI